VPTSVAIFGYLLAFGAGVSFVFQQAVNANLRVEIGSPWWAGFVSYLGGTIAMLLMAVVLLQPWPSMQMIYRSHWLLGPAAFGAIYIAISILLLPRLGAATVIALIVAGQMIGALAFDQFGLLGVPAHPLSMFRLVGAGLLVLGAILVRL
jgi:transporter family-2 protein